MPTVSTNMQTVNIYEAKTKLSKLVDLASSGTDVVIARAGKPVARLTALQNESWLSSRADDAASLGYAYLLLVVL